MNIITNFISQKILLESEISKKDGTSGKFILKNYPTETFKSLIEYFIKNEHDEILLIVDRQLPIDIINEKVINCDPEVMAQYRNENVQSSTIDLDSISYMVFITNEVIDTLNDISTLTPDDIKSEFYNVLEILEDSILDMESKNKLQIFCKVFFKEISGISPFEMEKFIISTISWMQKEGYILEEAMGSSINHLNSFSCRKLFEPLKKNFDAKSVKKIASSFKTISSALSKNIGNKSIKEEELKEKYKENKEDFDLLDQDIQELINKFITVDERERSSNKEEFSKLDWHESYIYRLFEKTKSDTSRTLGLDTIEILEEKDIDINERNREALIQYDSLPAKEREVLKHVLEPVYKEYKGYIEENRSLRSKWDKFLYPSQSKSNDFIIGLFETIKKLKADTTGIDHIFVSLKLSQPTAIMRNYSKNAINYLSKRYSILNRISSNIHFDFEFIEKIETTVTENRLPIVKKYRKGSTSKSLNELHFIIQAMDSSDKKLAERKLIWSFSPNSILSGYKEDIDALIKHLSTNNLFSNTVYRATGSEKGEKKPFTLFDYSSLEGRGQVSGYNLFPKTCKNIISSKNILKSAKELFTIELFKEFELKFTSYLENYLELLEELNINKNLKKEKYDFNKIEELSQKYIGLSQFLFENSNKDKIKSEIIEPFLSLVTVKVSGEESLIIPSFHPLRLISYFVKLKQSFSFIDEYIKNDDMLMIKEDLHFNDIEQNFNTPYYPEVFRLFNVDKNEESLLHISEVCDDYTILEPVKSYLESGQSTDISAQAAILTKVIENYISLNNHKQSSLKILLHAVNNYDFPVKFMKNLMALDFVTKENNFEIYLNDVDASHIRKMYRAFLVNQDSKEAEESLEYNEVSFLSNIRLNAFDQSFKQLNNVNDQLNIAFLNDFVSSKSKLVFRNQILKENYPLFDFHPPLWSKRKYMTEEETNVGKYLVSPSKTDLTSSFYNLLYLTMSTHKDDYKDKIPTLIVDHNHKSLHLDLEEIHQRTDWVINLDSLLDKKILEEFGANVIKYRKARHLNRNLVISSKANTILLKKHLQRKFNDLNVKGSLVDDSIEKIIKSTNELSGDILLKAIGKGSFANEMLGLVLTKTLIESLSTHDNILIYIDDYADWFLAAVNSEDKLLMTQNNVLADVLSLTPIFIDKKIQTIYIDIIETKFCNESNRAVLSKKSLQQTKDSYFQIEKVFKNNECADQEYWIAKISDLIVETYHKSFSFGFTSEDLRNEIRLNKNINFVVRGISFVFVYDYEDDEQIETGIEGINQYIIGLKSIVSMIENISDFSFSSKELDLPRYENLDSIDQVIIEKDTVKILAEKTESIISKDKISDTSVNEKKELEDKRVDSENIEGDEVCLSVRKVVNHHKYRAKISKFLFTPNAIRVSLEPELGWNENIFYKMANDFLAVKRLKLLRVEVVPGAYDLVFERNERQTIKYEDCLENRELTNGFGNTKILLGRNEVNNDVLYYNLDSEDPHALIAGMTKSGKSVLLNIFIIDLIRTNTVEELELILVDPKQVEFSRYENIPYLDDDGIITKKELAIEKLISIVDEMERRYSLFKEAKVNELNKYNKKVSDRLPRIVLIFDEFADWMLDDEFKRNASDAIQRLAGKARAAGIHLIVSTQRPDNTVVPMILRANLGAKFALRVDTEKNSNIIIDEAGAENLLGYGHMITKFAGKKQYIQSAYMSDKYIDESLSQL